MPLPKRQRNGVSDVSTKFHTTETADLRKIVINRKRK